LARQIHHKFEVEAPRILLQLNQDMRRSRVSFGCFCEEDKRKKRKKKEGKKEGNFYYYFFYVMLKFLKEIAHVVDDLIR